MFPFHTADFISARETSSLFMHFAEIRNSIQQDTKKNGICKNMKAIGIAQRFSTSLGNIHGASIPKKCPMDHKK
jgi:hypothetical protein